jgi:hypothetical protein
MAPQRGCLQNLHLMQLEGGLRVQELQPKAEFVDEQNLTALAGQGPTKMTPLPLLSLPSIDCKLHP